MKLLLLLGQNSNAVGNPFLAGGSNLATCGIVAAAGVEVLGGNLIGAIVTDVPIAGRWLK